MRHGADDASAGLRHAVVACAWAVALAVPAGAADGAASRGGGLVPTPRKTREELVREWDLNSDGKIDAGEAEVAASRMRRERAALRLNSGIDPVTGLPRGEDDDLDVEPGDTDIADEPDEEPVEEPDPETSPALPGTRVPRPRLPTGGASRIIVSDAAAAGGSGARPADAGSRADADRARQPLTGGVRAGGLPARAGYGAGLPAAPLNAGLPVPPRPNPATQRQSPAPRQRGGLVPSPRPAPSLPPSRPPASRDLYDPH